MAGADLGYTPLPSSAEDCPKTSGVAPSSSVDEPKEQAFMNRLFYGDNLDVLRRRKIPDESVDLIYLDPPFNSQRIYNIIFKEQSGAEAASQRQAFLDAWEWSQAAETYEELIQAGGPLAEILIALHAMLGPGDMLAYLSMMGARLQALHRTLKPTGSMYLHCDPTASHYLKVLMDAIFVPAAFRNEIVWKRTGAHNSAKRFGPVHDVILYYAKTDAVIWNHQFQDYDPKYLKKFGKRDGATGKFFQDVTLTGPGVRHGPSGQPWRGFNPTAKGRHWQPASYVYSKYEELTGEPLNKYPLLERLDRLDEIGLIYWPTKEGGQPRYKAFLEDAAGLPLSDVWTDIDVINSQSDERIGYPTQKPRQLLERIISASTNEGDIVFDPFCGCGTTIAAAQALNREWIGIDITARAIDIIIDRLRRDFPHITDSSYRVEQYPYSAPDARRLAEENKFHFQRWALEKLGVNPADIKPGADRGIDGVLYFADGSAGRTKRVVLSVKGGQRVTPRDVRELRGVLDRDGFQIGVLVSAVQPSDAALADIASGVRHFEASDGRRYPRLQSLTVDDIFGGRGVEYPDAGRHRTGIVPGEIVEPPPETMPLDFDADPLSETKRKKKPAKATMPPTLPAIQPKSKRGR
jgi:site-specific DNA-methyltransferase (adenine-specific)